jgi:hypothetical protein
MYCEECYNTGELDCHCGGDNCVCMNNGTYPCTHCDGGTRCDADQDPVMQDPERFKLLAPCGLAKMPDGPLPPVDQRSTLEMMNDRTSREEAAKKAIAITQQEGGKPSDYCIEQLDRFIDGEITAREMADRVVANASRKPDTEAADS